MSEGRGRRGATTYGPRKRINKDAVRKKGRKQSLMARLQKASSRGVRVLREKCMQMTVAVA